MTASTTPPSARPAPHAPAGGRVSPDRPRRRLPVDLIHRGFSSERVLVAAVAVGALIVMRFVVAIVQLIGNAVDYNPAVFAGGFLHSPIGLFLRFVVLDPLPFYIGAFLGAVALFPLGRASALRLALLRAVAAGVCGTALLIVTGLVSSVPSGDVATIVLGTVFGPLALGVSLTATFVGAAAAAWLWSGTLDRVPGAGGSAAAGDGDASDGDGDGPAQDPVAETTTDGSYRGGAASDPDPAPQATLPQSTLPQATLPSATLPQATLPAAPPASAPPRASMPPSDDLSRFQPPEAGQPSDDR